MDWEVALVSKMVQTGAVEEVHASGVESHHFADETCRNIFKTCIEHSTLWRVAPSLEVVQRQYPDFRFRPTPDALGYYVFHFIGEVNYRVGVEKWRDLGSALDNTPREKLPELFSEHARDMATLVPTPRMSRFSDMAERLVMAKKEQDAGLRPGIDLGFSGVDRLVKGVRPTEYVAFVAWQGVGKSTGLVRASFNSYLQGLRSMFVSLEMEDMEVLETFDSMATNISESAMRARDLSSEDYEAWQRAAERAKDAANEIIVIDDTQGAPTIDRLNALAERHQPDIVCVDYVSLMEGHRDFSGKDWERVTNISRALKRLAQARKIRVFAAAQSSRDAERDGPTLDNIAYSTAIGQDANIVIGFHQTPEMLGMQKMQVRTLKARKGPKGDYFEMWDRDRMKFEPWAREHEWALKLRQVSDHSS